jgi:16S rRNA (guanine966-N2)-methyltransferase
MRAFRIVTLPKPLLSFYHAPRVPGIFEAWSTLAFMRITGGVHRSRPLRAPRGDATRPTSDRVREALFSILSSQRTFEGARVLDLYAGTGALGLEALSRGASSATFVETSRWALGAIRENAAALELEERVRVVAVAVERSGEVLSADSPFDFIFADPPYALVASGAVAEVIRELVSKHVLSDDGLLVLEHGKNEVSPTIQGLTLSASRRYGDTVLAFYDSSPVVA